MLNFLELEVRTARGLLAKIKLPISKASYLLTLRDYILTLRDYALALRDY